MISPRPPWAGAAYAPKDRRLRLLLDRVARTTRVRAGPWEGPEDVPARRRYCDAVVDDARLVLMETISPLSFLLSAQPRGRASALYILRACLDYGRPTTLYADDVRDAHDYTAEWRAVSPVEVDMARAAARTAAGVRTTPLTIEDLERVALGTLMP